MTIESKRKPPRDDRDRDERERIRLEEVEHERMRQEEALDEALRPPLVRAYRGPL
jgi:hypothetical protein